MCVSSVEVSFIHHHIFGKAGHTDPAYKTCFIWIMDIQLHAKFFGTVIASLWRSFIIDEESIRWDESHEISSSLLCLVLPVHPYIRPKF